MSGPNFGDDYTYNGTEYNDKVRHLHETPKRLTPDAQDQRIAELTDRLERANAKLRDQGTQSIKLEIDSDIQVPTAVTTLVEALALGYVATYGRNVGLHRIKQFAAQVRLDCLLLQPNQGIDGLAGEERGPEFDDALEVVDAFLYALQKRVLRGTK